MRRSVWVLGLVAALGGALGCALGCDRDAPTVRRDRTWRLPPIPTATSSEAPVPPSPPPAPSPTTPPSPAPSAPPSPPFDKVAARAALAAVPHARCKVGRTVRVVVRFTPSGGLVVDKIGTPDPLPADTELCLIHAFEKASIPPFEGEPVTVAYVVR
ncbi:MAG: hypothetical protein HYV09_41470 [Deltaproteobacteria bacterium]|nr:hypothetical protein [Deltaproteobacteria bacterium]